MANEANKTKTNDVRIYTFYTYIEFIQLNCQSVDTFNQRPWFSTLGWKGQIVKAIERPWL